MNKVELTSSLWLYVIHSKNPELIHLLESYKVRPPHNSKSKEDYIQCFIECIKCHHNDIADYIENSYFFNQETNTKEEIISNCIKYCNYAYFETNSIISHGFYYLNLYHYNNLVNYIIKMKEKTILNKIIQLWNI